MNIFSKKVIEDLENARCEILEKSKQNEKGFLNLIVNAKSEKDVLDAAQAFRMTNETLIIQLEFLKNLRDKIEAVFKEYEKTEPLQKEKRKRGRPKKIE